MKVKINKFIFWGAVLVFVCLAVWSFQAGVAEGKPMSKLLPTVKQVEDGLDQGPVVGEITTSMWNLQSGTYLQPAGSSGYGLLIYGTSKYVNFGSVYSSSGYGIRDNAGTMQFKNSGGSWANIGSGGGGTGTVTSVDMSVPLGLSISGNPVTTSGTLALTYASGYRGLTDFASSTWDNKWDLASSTLRTNTLVGFDGSRLISTGTPQLTVGYILSTTTASSTFTGGITMANGAISNLLTVTRICFSQGECMSSPNVFGSAITLFLWNAPMTDIATYESLYTIPPIGTEVDESCTADADVDGGYCNLDSYVSTTTDISINAIPSGTWEFEGFNYVDSTAGNSKMETTVYKRDTAGTETFLFQATSSDINVSTPTISNYTSVQSAFTILPTDRIVFKKRAWTDQSAAKVIHQVYGSNNRYSRAKTPISTQNRAFAATANNETITGLWKFTNVGTTTYSGGIESSLISSPYFIATSTTASSTITYGLKILAGGLQVSNLATCDLDTDASGNLTCGTDSTASSTLLTDNNTFSGLNKFNNVSTTTFSGGIESPKVGAAYFFATSTTRSWLPYASSTGFTAVNLFANQLTVGGTATSTMSAGLETPMVGSAVIVATSSLSVVSDGASRLIPAYFYSTFTYATSTTWTGTTTLALGVASIPETWHSIQCFTDTLFLDVSLWDGTNRMDYALGASTTVGTVRLSTNNTFTAGEKRYADIGTSTPAAVKSISCTIKKSY